MVKKLFLTCRGCFEKINIFLSKRLSLMIFNCPHCSSLLVYYKKRCFLVNPKYVEKLAKTKNNYSIFKILYDIFRKQNKYGGIPYFKIYEDENMLINKQTIEPKIITEDDILNLKIELETCIDSKQFIDKL